MSYILAVVTVAIFLAKTNGRHLIRRRRLIRGVVLPLILILSIIPVLYVKIAPYQIRVHQQNINTGKLTNEIKIALMSDTHFRPLKRAAFMEKVAEHLEQIKPNLILFAGDFLFYNNAEKYRQDFDTFKKISAIAPTYAVLGNHDYGIGNKSRSMRYKDDSKKIKKYLEENGVRVLIDESVKLEISGQKFWLIGFDEFWKEEKNPAQAIANINDTLLKIGLSHNPDTSYLPEAKIIDLMLSAHTHGGQIRLPGKDALVGAETDFPREFYGRFIDKTIPKMFNTSGLGESGFAIRAFNPPEIAILNVR